MSLYYTFTYVFIHNVNEYLLKHYVWMFIAPFTYEIRGKLWIKTGYISFMQIYDETVYSKSYIFTKDFVLYIQLKKRVAKQWFNGESSEMSTIGMI